MGRTAMGALALGGLLYGTTPASAAEFGSAFSNTPDRVWAGRAYWANPMEDWQVRDGRLECTSRGPNRSVHLLTHCLGQGSGPFEISVLIDLLGAGDSRDASGSAGFRLGAKDTVDDYRAAALRGKGIDAGVTTSGELFLGPRRVPTERPFRGGTLRLRGEPADGEPGRYVLHLTLADGPAGEAMAPLRWEGVTAERLAGGVALVSDGASRNAGSGPRFAFRQWRLSGEPVEAHPERAFGPILWAMHTLSDSRGPEGHVLKMTAQMPPLGPRASRAVSLETRSEGQWEDRGQAEIDPDARTATFRVSGWPADRNTPYRLRYRATGRDGATTDHFYAGTVRRDPADRPLVVAGFTGNIDYNFPNLEIARNLRIHDPDLLFFSGDQIYESVGGYGIIRTPADRSILNYLRKWYLLGWALGDLMRDRVTLCLPDDHDVYQGNIWGEGGRDCGGIAGHAAGGYAQPVPMVNAVHRSQTSHHPDPYDPTPIERGISVYYGDMVYGRVSFAVLADRQFKSGPQDKVNTWPGRPDHIMEPDFDVRTVDKPGLKLLGDRQLDFLRTWAADWRGADMKVALSQTIFCNLANYHGPQQAFIVADLDSNGWPQAGRNRALDALRRGCAFHLAGDQHLASLVRHGIDHFGDAGWSFCVPSIAAGYPRAWRPDEEGRPVQHRPAPGLPNTGDYHDGLGNKVSVFAIGNPEKTRRPGPGNTAHDKASGYGLVHLDQEDRTLTVECWRLQFDAAHPRPGDQFPGWPRTISMYENDGRAAAAWLPTVAVTGTRHPVVQVVNEDSGAVEYTLRIRGTRYEPRVFSSDGTYTLRVGIPETDTWLTYPGLTGEGQPGTRRVEARF